MSKSGFPLFLLLLRTYLFKFCEESLAPLAFLHNKSLKVSIASLISCATVISFSTFTVTLCTVCWRFSVNNRFSWTLGITTWDSICVFYKEFSENFCTKFEMEISSSPWINDCFIFRLKRDNFRFESNVVFADDELFPIFYCLSRTI